MMDEWFHHYWGYIHMVPDEATDEEVEKHYHEAAIASWALSAREKGFVPVGTPTITLHVTAIPFYLELDDGTKIKTPDRCLRVEGKIRKDTGDGNSVRQP